MLPHRYPFLLVDRVIEITPNESLAGIKNVTMNEPFFQAISGTPVMPGVLVIEAMAQAAGLLTQLSDDGSGGGDKPAYLVKVDKARFEDRGSGRPAAPGSEAAAHAPAHGPEYECRALVDGSEVASAEILCAERDA